MDWTREQKLKGLLRLPWTVRTERNASGGYLVARVVELPSVLATGETEKELARDLWESLEASLSCYLEFGDPIPLPKGAVLPWEGPARTQRALVHVSLRGTAWEVRRESETVASTAAGHLFEV